MATMMMMHTSPPCRLPLVHPIPRVDGRVQIKPDAKEDHGSVVMKVGLCHRLLAAVE